MAIAKAISDAKVTAPTEVREWFTATELADLALPGLPGDKRAINRRARHENWRVKVDNRGQLLSRPRDARGGGDEFHVSLLPGEARIELARRGITASQPVAVETDAAAASWRWFDDQSAKVKAEARRRIEVINQIAMLTDSGQTRSAAVAALAGPRSGVGKATLWNWLALVDGVAPHNWLPALAPRRRGGGAEADIDADIWTAFKSDFCRPEEPTLTLCYERAKAIAEARGLTMPSERTMRRRLERDLDPRIIMRLRKGAEAVRRSVPAQRRTVEHLHVLEWVNIDGHTCDVRVGLPDGQDASPRGGETFLRPILIGIQDIRSSKVLAWRVCETESAHHVRLVFGQLFERFGIPKHAVLDNGRGFASKWITGGTKTRFRFKIREEEPTGLLTSLGIGVHWAIPFHGQSKPIERAWLDLTDRIARHPFVAGAYTGRNPTKKPENYGSRVIPWAEFVAHVDRQITAHNAKLGRRGRDYRGRSFDDVFATGYATAPIGKATPEQLRLALLAAEQKMVNRQTGEIQLFGNRYWSEAHSRLGLHGQRLTVRFDPDDLSKDIHVYDQDDHYLCSSQRWDDVKFDSVDEAKKRAKFEAEMRRKIRAGIEAEQFLTAAQVAALQVDAPEPSLPEPGVIRPVRHRGRTVAALKAEPVAPSTHESKVFAGLSKLRLVE